MNKRNLVLLLMILTLSTSMTSMVLGINTYCDDSQKENIILDQTDAWDEGEKARTLNRLIWTCYYENGRVYLNVPFEMGSVSLTVTNLVTGETWYYIQESGFGWTVLPTSQAQGNYRVVVETESYGEYIGYYNL